MDLNKLKKAELVELAANQAVQINELTNIIAEQDITIDKLVAPNDDEPLEGQTGKFIGIVPGAMEKRFHVVLVVLEDGVEISSSLLLENAMHRSAYTELMEQCYFNFHHRGGRPKGKFVK